jgi:predicted RecB family nuclease
MSLDTLPFIDYSSTFGTGPAPVAATVKCHSELRTRLNEATSQQQAAEAARNAAPALDKAAAVAAFAKGLPDPGTKHRDEAEVLLADAKRRSQAGATAVRDAFADVVAAVEEHAPAWLAEISAEVEDTRTTLAATLAQVEGLLRHLDHLDHLSRMVAEPAERKAHRRPISQVLVPGITDRTFSTATLLGVLRGYRSRLSDDLAARMVEVA